MTIELTIDGMHCQGCIDVIHTALDTLPGITVRGVGIGMAVVDVQPPEGSVESVLNALQRLGYEGHIKSIQESAQ